MPQDNKWDDDEQCWQPECKVEIENTTRGSDVGKMSTTHTLMVRLCVGATRGVAYAQAVKFTIDTNGAILIMGGKDEVRGGQGFHDVIITIEDEVTGERETT